MSKAQPKAQRTSHASKPRKSATNSKSPPKAGASGTSASRLIDQRIRDLEGWRGETLARMRALILQADAEMIEEVKWMGTPVWSHDGIVCTGESYTKVVKLTFARGAEIEDPARIFNSSLDGNTRRAIDIHEGEKVDAGAFKALVKAAVARNVSSRASKPRTSAGKSKSAPKAGTKGKPSTSEKERSQVRSGAKVVLLSGGNPRIAKADGDAPVQAYIAALPGWKRDLGMRLDALIARNVPNVKKAMKWNTPFYGIEDEGWFLGFHTFTRYVKVAFFRGTLLRPIPPGISKGQDTRYVDIHEGELDEVQMATWVRQAAALPGWVPGRPAS